jgi:hypothetical protein
MKYGGVPEVEGNELQRELGLLCPWCKDRTNGSKAKSNTKHLHVYCPNARICKVRETTNDCLEDFLKEFVAAVEIMKKETSHNKDIIGDIYMFMHDIPSNDCALPGCEHPISPRSENHSFKGEMEPYQGRPRAPTISASHKMENSLYM